MIEESGKVIAVTADGVLVETVRQSACNSCRAAKGCGQKLLASVGQGQRFEVLADNPRNLILQAGDQVVLGLAEGAFLKASALAYLLPLVVMIVAAVVAELSGQPEAVVAVAGLLGLALGFGCLKWLVVPGGDQCQFNPEILRTERSGISVNS